MQKKIKSENAIGIILLISLMFGIAIYFNANEKADKDMTENVGRNEGIGRKDNEDILEANCAKKGGHIYNAEKNNGIIKFCSLNPYNDPKNDCPLTDFYEEKCGIKRIVNLKADDKSCLDYKNKLPLLDVTEGIVEAKYLKVKEDLYLTDYLGKMCVIKSLNSRGETIVSDLIDDLREQGYVEIGGGSGIDGESFNFKNGNGEFLHLEYYLPDGKGFLIGASVTE